MQDEDFAEGFLFVGYPRLHGGDESAAANEIHLQGDDAKQQVLVSDGVHGGKE
jgi:hypothetical protein